MNIADKKFVLYNLTLLVVGSLLSHISGIFAMWWMIVIAGIFSVSSILLYHKEIRNFKEQNKEIKISVVITVVMSLITIHSIIVQNVMWFAMISLMFIEYYLRDNREKNR